MRQKAHAVSFPTQQAAGQRPMPGMRQRVVALCWALTWRKHCAQALHLCEFDVAIRVNVQLLHDVVEFLVRRLVTQLLEAGLKFLCITLHHVSQGVVGR